MKKSLIALAVFGAFSGAALADGNSVQLYGLIDLGVTHFTGGTGGNITKLSSGVQSGSRIGLKGTEDLGGGLKAFFQVETGFCANGASGSGASGADQYCTGSGQFMGRTSEVGLTGDFGTFVMGRIYSLTFDDQAAIDPFGYGLTGSISNIGTLGAPARVNQALAYVSPNFSGFHFAGAYIFSNPNSAATTVQKKTTGAYNLEAGYTNGPVNVSVTYLNAYDAVGATATGNSALKHTEVIGSYNFGVAKLDGMYAQAKSDTSSLNEKAYMLGVDVPVGPGDILASYTKLKDDSTAGNAGAKQYAIGYTYSLSKRTNLYTSYAHISNDTGASYAVGDSTDAGFAPVAGGSSSGFAVGLRHQF